MNFALSDEQEFLKEAARGTLSRTKTLEAARGALEGEALPDLWPTACEAGWPGLLISEEHGGAGLGVMDAMLVFEELGRVLASVELLGHLPATYILDAAGDGELLAALASGDKRAAYVPARPATTSMRAGPSSPNAAARAPRRRPCPPTGPSTGPPTGCRTRRTPTTSSLSPQTIRARRARCWSRPGPPD